MYDVSIVGAGPSGCLLAGLLSSKGYSVTILEEHPSPGEPVNCSGIIGVEAFQRFDLPRNTIIRSIDSFRFFSPEGAILKYRHPETLSFAVNRSLFDVALADSAVSAGADLQLGARVNRIKPAPGFVDLTVNGDRTVRSKFVVLATGAGSRLPEQVGLGALRKYVLGAQTECRTQSLADVEIYFGKRVAPSNFAWVIPVQQGYAKIGLICKRNAALLLKKFLSGPSLRDRILAEGKYRCSVLPLETLSRTYAPRTIVIGEAAGQIKTITCGGIYYGMLAAEIAAEVLGTALEKNSKNPQLEEYETRWRALFQRELDIGLRVRSVFERMSDLQINALFDIATKDGIMKLVREKVNFDWHYDLIRAVFRHSLVHALLQPVTYGKLLL